VTLTQLRAFAAVARLGSVKAAAQELGVSEPAVSAAVAALRGDLGDPLYVRNGRGVVLTPGGQRLAVLAAEIVDLAARARSSVGEDDDHAPRPLNVAITAMVEEHVAAPLLDAFTDHRPGQAVSLEVAPPERFSELLDHRRADVTLGPAPDDDRIAAVPFMRYRMVIVASPHHRLAGRAELLPSALAGERWLVGPAGTAPTTPVGRFFVRHRLAPPDVRVFPSDAAAVAAAEAGEGVMAVLAHTVVDALRRRALARLDVRGTPAVGLWHVATLDDDRCLPGAQALRRFATTREAMQAIAAPRHGVPAARIRPQVHVTLWESVAGDRS